MTESKQSNFEFQTNKSKSDILSAISQAVDKTNIDKSWGTEAKLYLQSSLCVLIGVIDHLYSGQWKDVRIEEALLKIEQLAVRESIKSYGRRKTLQKYPILHTIREHIVRNYQVGRSETVLVGKVYENAVSILATGDLPTSINKPSEKLAFMKRPTSYGRKSSTRVAFGRKRYS